MPNSDGYITNVEVRRMVEMREAGLSRPAIASAIGCSEGTVQRYVSHIPFERPRRVIDLTYRRERAARYARLVELASAYVPTFGGGR